MVHDQLEEGFCLRRVQIYRVPEYVTSFTSGVIVSQYRLPVFFRVAEWKQRGAKRCCMLDAVYARADGVACIDDLEMAHHRNTARVCSFNCDSYQRERQAVVDLDRRSTIID